MSNGRRGHWHTPIEKAHDARKSLRRLLRYFGKETKLVIAAVLFIAVSVLLNALGPRILGSAINFLIKCIKLPLLMQ